jgi:hypothetical protein
LTTGVVIAASSFNKVTEFGYWLSQFVDLVPSDEYRLVIRDSVAGDMCFGYGYGYGYGYGNGYAALYATMDDCHEQCTIKNMWNISCIISQSVLSQCLLSGSGV